MQRKKACQVFGNLAGWSDKPRTAAQDSTSGYCFVSVLSVDRLARSDGLASVICNRQCQRPRSFTGDAITCFQR